MGDFDGLGMHLGNLARLSDARTRSISAQNPTGAKGRGGMATEGTRWHVMDPIRFASDLRVTIQALGWRAPVGGERRYLPLQDDIASTAYWYQTEPHAPFLPLPDADTLEVI